MKLLNSVAVVAWATLALASSSWPANGLAPSRQDLIDQAVAQVKSVISSPYLENNCTRCIAGLEVGKFLALTVPDIVPDVLTQLCQDENYPSFDACNVSFGSYTLSEAKSGTDVTNVLKLIDPAGLDGQYICYYQMSQACPLPETPKFDLSTWFPPKPENLTVPEPSGETFNVIHVSDLHIDLNYKVGAEADCSQYMCCQPWSFSTKAANGTVRQPATKWGDYYCDSPQVLIDNSLSTINKISQTDGLDFAFAIFTGDMVDHDDDQYISFEYTVQEEEAIYVSLKENLQNIPVYATLGNHDSFPYAQLPQKNSGAELMYKWNTDLAANMWSDFGWIDQEAAQDVRNEYGGFAVTTKQGLRVISVDSNIWYYSNYYNYWNTSSPDSFGVFQWLVSELVDSEKQGQRVWIIAHVPLGGDLSNAMAAPSNVFGQIIERFAPETIAAIFLGHTHEDQFNIFYSNGGAVRDADTAISVGYLAPSITPLAGYNPGWRYYKVDSKTFDVMDSVNYYFRLNDTFDDPSAEPQWELGYSARQQYDINGTWPANAPLNGSFWHNAAHAIYNNETLRNQYLANEYRYSPSVSECNSVKCRQSMLCYFTSGTVDMARACEAQYNITDPDWF